MAVGWYAVHLLRDAHHISRAIGTGTEPRAILVDTHALLRRWVRNRGTLALATALAIPLNHLLTQGAPLATTLGLIAAVLIALASIYALTTVPAAPPTR